LCESDYVVINYKIIILSPINYKIIYNFTYTHTHTHTHTHGEREREKERENFQLVYISIISMIEINVIIIYAAILRELIFL